MWTYVENCMQSKRTKKGGTTSLVIAVDSRSRMSPQLPIEYFGNVTFYVIAQSMVGDLLLKLLGFAASKIKEAIEKVINEYVRSGIELLKNQKDLIKFQDIHNEEGPPFYGNPNLIVASWVTLPIHGFDFGWGKEKYMGLEPYEEDGESLLLPSLEGDGSIVIAMCLRDAHMNAFKKHFYEHVQVLSK